jgi:hypothetical protein
MSASGRFLMKRSFMMKISNFHYRTTAQRCSAVTGEKRSDDQVERAADIADLPRLPMQHISARCAAGWRMGAEAWRRRAMRPAI